MITTKQVRVPSANTGFVVFGPFPPDTRLVRLDLLFMRATTSTSSFRVGLCPGIPGAAASFDAAHLITEPLELNLDGGNLTIIVNIDRVCDFNRLLILEVTADTAEVRGIASLSVSLPAPLPLAGPTDLERVLDLQQKLIEQLSGLGGGNVRLVAPPAYPPDAEIRAAEAAAAAAPRRPDGRPQSKREGRGDDVFVGMVKRALAEFFVAKLPG